MGSMRHVCKSMSGGEKMDRELLVPLQARTEMGGPGAHTDLTCSTVDLGQRKRELGNYMWVEKALAWRGKWHLRGQRCSTSEDQLAEGNK